MAINGDEKQDKFDFTDSGEALEWVTLEQARVQAIEHARDNTGFYGAEYAEVRLVWEVLSQDEGEDFYDIKLSFRPSGRYRGEPGVEQFIFDKTGELRVRQILDEPSQLSPTPREAPPTAPTAPLPVETLSAGSATAAEHTSIPDPAPTNEVTETLPRADTAKPGATGPTPISATGPRFLKPAVIGLVLVAAVAVVAVVLLGRESSTSTPSVASPVPSQSTGVSVLAKWGTFGTGDGQFDFPSGIAVDGQGKVYVAGHGNHRVQVFDTDGRFLRKWGTQGSGDGQFEAPLGIAVDGAGNVYVADTENHRVQMFDDTGRFLAKWGTQGNTNGEFAFPNAIAVDRSGNVYVADTENHRVQVFDETGRFLRKWGTPGAGEGRFDLPSGISVDGKGDVYVADTENHRIQVFDETGRFLREWGYWGSQDGQFLQPRGIAVDKDGDVYVADWGNSRMQVFNSRGLFIGKWGEQGIGEGQLFSPWSIAVDLANNFYVADTNNNRVQILASAR